MVDGLPAGSNLDHDLHGPRAAWTWADEYAFQSFGLLTAWHWQWVSSHSKSPPQRPPELRRPWEVEEDQAKPLPPLATREEVAAFFGRSLGPNVSGETGLSVRYTPDPAVEGDPAPGES